MDLFGVLVSACVVLCGMLITAQGARVVQRRRRVRTIHREAVLRRLHRETQQVQ